MKGKQGTVFGLYKTFYLTQLGSVLLRLEYDMIVNRYVNCYVINYLQEEVATAPLSNQTFFNYYSKSIST